MKLNVGIEHALNGNAILFTGSGFSKGATNIQDGNFLTGRELRMLLQKESGIAEEITLGLAAEMFIKHNKSVDPLIALLHKQYTTKSVASHHRLIGSVNWRRIYTTNYDNVLEIAYSENSRKLAPVTLAHDPAQLSSKVDVCVHINGYIDLLTRESIFNTFKLTDTSYLTDDFSKSDWAFIFRTDLRQAQAIFFLGYSLYDIDITRILYEEPELIEKCFFITQPDPSPALKFTLDKFGTVIPEGVTSFANKIDDRKRTWNPAKIEPVYVAFENVQAPKILSEIKDQDIFNLFLYGRDNTDLIYSSLLTPKDVKYYIRRAAIDSIFSSIGKGRKTFLLSSALGNGKTHLCLGIAFSALAKGYKVFLCKDGGDYLEKEISSICKLDEPVILIIENYHRYLNKIRHLQLNRSARLILILTARAETNDIYYEDLVEALRGANPDTINIDHIDNEAIKQIVEVFDNYGLWGTLAAKKNADKIRYIHRLDDSFQRLLLELLNSPDIINRFVDILTGLNEIRGVTEVIVVACALTMLNYEPRLSTISELLEANVAGDIKFRKDPRIREVVDIYKDTIGIKSPIFGRFLLSHIPDSSLVIDTIIRIAKKADNLARIDTTFRLLFRELIRFSNLQLILPEHQRRPAIINFYEALKNLRSTEKNPQFWLQYAIARLSFPELDEAKVYFNTSYALAGAIPNYDTTQIDNHYARYLLERAIREENPHIAFDQYSEANALLGKQILRPNRHYPYRVAIGYYEFFLKHYDKLNPDQKESFRVSSQAILARIGKLDPYIKEHKYVKECKEKLTEIVNTAQV